MQGPCNDRLYTSLRRFFWDQRLRHSREVDFKRPSVADRRPRRRPRRLGGQPWPAHRLLPATGQGHGFNTIFRPNNPTTPTFPPPLATSDNVLELNLTQESLSFSPNLSSIPNRGSGTQGDIFLNGVPYLQQINDVTSLPANGIHFEPGMWLSVPVTTNPNEPATLARMASIPHGTTIVSQGVVLASVAGKPTIASIDITPFVGWPTDEQDPVREPDGHQQCDSPPAAKSGPLRRRRDDHAGDGHRPQHRAPRSNPASEPSRRPW